MTIQKLKNKTQGFTIIEVLIVLAIAGLIMLIVFLAVPALQRNSRNNARNNDASRVASAAQECLSNRNGIVAQCTAAVIKDLTGTTSQLENVSTGSKTFSLSNARVVFGGECTAAGNDVTTGGSISSRSIAVSYALESGGSNINRCVGS